MTAQKGSALLLKLFDGAAYASVAGLRTKSLTLNAQAIDITNADSVGPWRELLDHAGVRSASLSGAGIFKDAASDALVRQLVFDGQIEQWQIVLPDFGTIEGPFLVTSLRYQGEHDGEMTFDLSLESAGALAFMAA